MVKHKAAAMQHIKHIKAAKHQLLGSRKNVISSFHRMVQGKSRTLGDASEWMDADMAYHCVEKLCPKVPCLLSGFHLELPLLLRL
ncbi:uncharacterized protein FA14DRAFT_55200 [Meira miltonrushii]|uniref:Uncharacterized protein n=1 Tax=Meira miltonrushii TaxID=1280837 RepID=A0A316VFX3_9BASI|nr:uncharacterized protein FA14DRAFT_55200 [Meira miltonrushii]PWN36426.1 hypothetical protein FA14DRAFT_55200 [Meira miltonrushii]